MGSAASSMWWRLSRNRAQRQELMQNVKPDMLEKPCRRNIRVADPKTGDMGKDSLSRLVREGLLCETAYPFTM